MSIASHTYLTDGIPLWVLEPENYRAAVILHHGLHSHKEAQEKEMWSLAQAGFLAAGVDALGHGQRCEPYDWKNPEVRYATLRQTALELPRLVAHLRERFPQARRIGGLGVSLGGFTLFSAMVENPGLLAAASLILGSPQWAGLSPQSPTWGHSPHHWLDRFYPTALLIQNAGQDEHVRTAHAREFHQAVGPHYAQAPERLAYHEYPRSGHFMRSDDWDLAWHNTLNWFASYLSGEGP